MVSDSVHLVSQDEYGSALGRIEVTAYVDDGPATLPRPYRVLDSYVLAVVHRGEGRYHAPGHAAVRVGPGDAILVVPGHPHWYGPDQTWDETFVVFDGPVFDALGGAGVLASDKAVRQLPVTEQWERNIRRFVERTGARSGSRERYHAVLELASLLVELYVADPELPARSRAIRQARDALDEDLTAELDLHVLAHQVGLPYETFRKRFRSEIGVSPARFREDRRLEVARTLLRVTSMTHAGIAAKLGFADEHHFSKRFRARTGVPPREYRQQ